MYDNYKKEYTQVWSIINKFQKVLIQILCVMTEEKDTTTIPLDENDINLLKKYEKIKQLEEENNNSIATINIMLGIKESDIGLSIPSTWDLVADQKLALEHPFTMAKCTKIYKLLFQQKDLYMITIKHIAKYAVGLGEKVAPTDIEEGMR